MAAAKYQVNVFPMLSITLYVQANSQLDFLINSLDSFHLILSALITLSK